ncbi:MAG: TolC family protein [Prevotellaceae bacterium]|jgi:outer membrane protein|nr:TolC family protein [Prevotellaceae bacterium]
MKKIFFSTLIFCPIILYGQNVWTLDKCIEYAQERNITIKQSELQQKSSQLDLQTARLSFLPDLNLGVGQDFAFGRATGSDNVIVSQSLASSSLSVYSSIPLFTGLRLVNQIQSNKLGLRAAIAELDKAKENLTLNIASFYLQILLNKELLAIAQEQLALSSEQVERSQQLFAAGRQSEAALYEARAQLADDEQKQVVANNNLQLSLLSLCQLINYTELESFDIAQANIELANGLSLLSSPEDAYRFSLEHRPSIVVSRLLLEKSRKEEKIAQSAFYPQLSLSGGYSTGYYYMFNTVVNQPFSKQLLDNGGESVRLSLSVPIFNRLGDVNSVKKAKISSHLQELSLENAKQELYRDIQTAYYNALAALERYRAAVKATAAAQLAFDFEQKRYESGKSTALEYSTAKIRLERTKGDEAQAKFEYIFRTKILDFYNGKPIEI